MLVVCVEISNFHEIYFRLDCVIYNGKKKGHV